MTNPETAQPVDLTACGAAVGLNPGSPVALRDVIAAARILVNKQERREYVSWRTDRWFTDEALAYDIVYDRRQEFFGERGAWPLRPLFDNIRAQEIILSALPGAPEDIIDCLHYLRLTSDSADATYHAAFQILDATAQQWYDAIHAIALPLVDVPPLRARLGDTALGLALTIGWDVVAIHEAAHDPTGDSGRALQALAALRN